MSKETYYRQLIKGHSRLIRQPASERNPHKLQRIKRELLRIAQRACEDCSLSPKGLYLLDGKLYSSCAECDGSECNELPPL